MSPLLESSERTVGKSIEFQGTAPIRPDASLLVFDFDGTLSWLRHGWPEMMLETFLDQLDGALGDVNEELHSYLIGQILSLNGKPSIFQCRLLSEIAVAKGGPILDPESLRADFQSRLDTAILERMDSIRYGKAVKDQYVIFGARSFLDHARNLGLKLAILSSTVQNRVREEAELLGIAEYFGAHIYGGVGDPLLFSKRAIFDRLLESEKCPPERLLSFGDGPVEIRDTAELGGLAVAVCSDELANGSGVIDPHKRTGLFAVGASIAIPDYRDAPLVLDLILGK